MTSKPDDGGRDVKEEHDAEEHDAHGGEDEVEDATHAIAIADENEDETENENEDETQNENEQDESTEGEGKRRSGQGEEPHSRPGARMPALRGWRDALRHPVRHPVRHPDDGAS